MNKRIWLVLLLTCALALSVNALYDATDASSQNYHAPYGDIYVVQLRYEPFPVSPGAYVDVWYKIENRGDTDLAGVEFTLLPDFPFSIDSNDVATKNLGTIAVHSSALVKFKVRVSESALQGDQPLKFTWQAAGQDRAQVQSTDISVISSNSMLVVSSVKATPDAVVPSGESTVEIEVANVGDSFLRFVTVGLQLVASTSSGIVELPFTPVGQGVSQSITNIAPGEKATLRFPVVASADAASKPYKIPIFINYVDSAGRNLSRSEIVGITVHAEPDLLVYIDKNDLRDPNTPADVVLRFVNKGRSDVKFLTATIQDTNKFNVINSPTQYVGAVNSDDYETASWTLKLKAVQTSLDLPLVITYQDALGKPYSQGMTVAVPIHSLADLGQTTTNYSGIFIAIVIILVVGFIIYRKGKNRKKRVE